MSYFPSMQPYDSRKAWFRAGIFFIVATGIGLASGVTQALLRRPLLPMDEVSSLFWLGATLIYLAIIVIGYGIIWPRGTLSHGRPLKPLWALGFGLFWGLAQGQVFLSIWSTAGLLGLGRWWTALIAYVVIGAYQGLWHGLYWDIKVSPPHNIKSWNGRKVALAHTPNLLFTLAYLGWFGFDSAWFVVSMQTLALMLSCWFMHFPAPGDDGAPEPQPDD